MTQIILAANSAFLAKAQSARGVPAAYTGADSVIATGEPSIKIDYTTIDANLANVERGAHQKKFSYKKGTLEISVDLGLGGANRTPVPGSLPQYDALLRACAMQRLSSGVADIGTLDGGSRDAFVLPSGASDVDGFYCGHFLAVKIQSGNTQAPGSTAKNVVKLAAAINENAGTALTGSTTTNVKLSANASKNDDDYVGQDLVIGSDTRTITAYNGTTQTATVGTAFGSATAGEVYKILFEDDALVGYVFGITHFTGTITDGGGKNSNKNTIYLPSSVGNTYLGGCYLTITTGSNDPETVRISAYDSVNRKATLQTALQTEPSNASTFAVLEKRTIKAFDSATKVCTLASNLVVASVNNKAYAIEESRRIVEYNGTTLYGKVSPPFSRFVGASDYTINPYVMYSTLPTKTGETLITIATYHDGLFYEFVDVQGDVTITENFNESITAKFSLQGAVNVYDDMPLPDEALYRYVPSLVVSSTNSPVSMICGYPDAVVHSFEFALGNAVSYRDIDKRAFITDHMPTVKSKIDKTYKDVWDFELLMRSDALNPSFFAVGDIGNSVCVFLEKTQITGAADSNTDAVVTVDLDLTVNSGIKRIVLC